MKSPSATPWAAAALALAMVFTPAAAQESAPDTTPENVWSHLMNGPSAGAWGVSSDLGPEYVRVEMAPGPREPIAAPPWTAEFGAGVRVQGTDGPNPWSVQASKPVGGAIAQGDAIFVILFARAERAAGLGSSLPMRLQMNTAPYPGFMETTFELTGQWKHFCSFAIAPRDFAAEGLVMVLHMSMGDHVIDLGPALIFNFGPYDPATMPTCPE